MPAGPGQGSRLVTDVIHGLGGGERMRVAARRAQGRFFWLDASLGETSRDELADALGISKRVLRALPGSGDASAARACHVEGDSIFFALRCYVDAKTPADDGAYRLKRLEVQILVTSEYVLTLHEAPVSLPEVLAADLPEGRSKPYVVYSVLDAMLATTFEALDEVEQRLDDLAATWTDGSGRRVSTATLREAGTRLSTMRRWVGAEQTVLERVGVEIGALPGFEADDDPYFDRLDQQVNRLLASIDAASNGMGMLLDLQLNERAYVVSVVATIFVPLTFITGFFGMNFGWLVDRIDTPLAFWLLGFLVPIATAALSWRFLVRRFLTGERD
jgi:magnesium transporter